MRDRTDSWLPAGDEEEGHQVLPRFTGEITQQSISDALGKFTPDQEKPVREEKRQHRKAREECRNHSKKREGACEEHF